MSNENTVNTAKELKANDESDASIDSDWLYYAIRYTAQITSSPQIQTEKILPAFNDQDHNMVVFTHPSEINPRSLISRINHIISEAVAKNQFILVCGFDLSNTELINTLIDAAKRLLGKVYILIGKDLSAFGSYNKNGMYDPIGLNDLVKNGALIRKKKGAHLKFILAGENAILTTANFTSEGLYRNPEFGIHFIQDPAITKGLKMLFSFLWHQKSEKALINSNWIKAPNWNINSILLKNPISNSPQLLLSSETLQQEINNIGVVIKGKTLYETIREMLSSAQKFIQISIYAIESNEKSKIEKILQILIAKASNKQSKIEISLLVPEVKTRFSGSMKKILLKLKNAGVQIRYYRELHGKIIIVDQKSALIFTGNLDNYLLDPTSYDIGYIATNPAMVHNFEELYNHLWNEAASECGAAAQIQLNLNLAVKSAEYLSDRFGLSVSQVSEIINKSPEIRWVYGPNQSKLFIDQAGKRPLVLLLDHQTIDFENENVEISAILSTISTLVDKNAETFRINRLYIRLYWNNNIED